MLLMVLLIAKPVTVLAEENEQIYRGNVVQLEIQEGGELVSLFLVDEHGNINKFNVDNSSVYGLENRTGDRWISNQEKGGVEVVDLLRDHQIRFVPVVITSKNGVATSVVELEKGKLETNLGFLFAVFSITWVVFFGYVIFISIKQKQLQKELKVLRVGGNEANKL